MGAARADWVVGLNHGSHDAACALLCGGKLVAFAEEERFARQKKAPGLPPVKAMAWCLEHAGIGLDQVRCIALGSDHEALSLWLGDTPEAAYVRGLADRTRLIPTDVFGHAQPDILTFPHHLAHAASAYWPSGFAEAAVLVIDAMGENTSGLIAFGDKTGLHHVESIGLEHSLGFFMEAASQFAGFGKDDAGKLMGLAAYGHPIEPMPLLGCRRMGPHVAPGSRPTRLDGRAGIEAQTESLLEFFADRCFPYAKADAREIMAHANFAASAQDALARAVLALAGRAKATTGAQRLVLSGGVALNCTANGMLSVAGLFDEVFVQPVAHDAGVALGAALLASVALDGPVKPPPMRHAYWGPSESDDEIAATLEFHGVSYRCLKYADVASVVADIITGGGVVAWHQGRAEIGPRALGARSLLGDPRHRSTLLKINAIKDREMWRPLAPSVLHERFDAYFEGVPDSFMLKAARVRPSARRLLPAATHVDGSSRPQAVRGTDNPLFADLLHALDQRTGLPVVVNTSLNRGHEPIACTAADTIAIWRTRDIDAAIIGPFLVERT